MSVLIFYCNKTGICCTVVMPQSYNHVDLLALFCDWFVISHCFKVICFLQLFYVTLRFYLWLQMKQKWKQKVLVRVHISAKWSDLNITTTTITTTPYNKERGGRRSHFVEGRKSNSRCFCLCCWCNDVIAIMSHQNDGTMETRTEQPISLSPPMFTMFTLGGDRNRKYISWD